MRYTGRPAAARRSQKFVGRSGGRSAIPPARFTEPKKRHEAAPPPPPQSRTTPPHQPAVSSPAHAPPPNAPKSGLASSTTIFFCHLFPLQGAIASQVLFLRPSNQAVYALEVGLTVQEQQLHHVLPHHHLVRPEHAHDINSRVTLSSPAGGGLCMRAMCELRLH